MIDIIYGAKGSGKTKQIIDRANDGIQKNLGDIVFIADTSRYIHDVKYQIRFTNTKENDIGSEESLIGFIKGMLEANYDIRYIYIDGAARMMGKSLYETEGFYNKLEKIAEKSDVNFILTVSAAYEDIPVFIKKYIKNVA
jgi:hypothetical protein